MSQTSAIPASVSTSGNATSADNSQPQASGSTGKFGRILGTIVSTAANIAAPGLGGVLGGNFSSVLSNNNPIQYLELQQQMLSEARAFETVSNVLKAKHDSAMAAIRNVRPS
jgi:hypothetical protein